LQNRMIMRKKKKGTASEKEGRKQIGVPGEGPEVSINGGGQEKKMKKH